MTDILIIPICLFAGMAIKKFKAMPHDSYKLINAWLINIALPAIALKYLPTIEWNKKLIFPILMPVIIWFFGVLFVKVLSCFIKMENPTKAAILLLLGLSNTSFTGFPLTKAFYKEEGLKVAILCDQSTFIVMATFATITAMRHSPHIEFKLNKVVKKIMSFPPFLALITALILPLFIDISPINPILSTIASTMVPIAIFSVGFQLDIKEWKADVHIISLGLFYKLILAPFIILILCHATQFHNLMGKVTLLESSMAPMVTGAIIATEYNLNPKLANMISSIGIPLSFVTVVFWYFISSVFL